jgi:hypothetical protein
MSIEIGDNDAFSRARQRWSLVDAHFDPSTFDEPMLRMLWRFRGRFMALKPHVDPEEDFLVRRMMGTMSPGGDLRRGRASGGARQLHTHPCS